MRKSNRLISRRVSRTARTPTAMRACVLVVSATLAVLAGSAGTARAANTLTVDFESGPPLGVHLRVGPSPRG